MLTCLLWESFGELFESCSNAYRKLTVGDNYAAASKSFHLEVLRYSASRTAEIQGKIKKKKKKIERLAIKNRKHTISEGILQCYSSS